MRVFVAMSGGVDSSVAAALLAEAGHDIVGVTMQIWPEGDAEGGCCAVSAARDARRVCDVLGVPHYVLNFRDVFEERVVRPFVEAYAAGLTPNPCVACNDLVKFDELLRRVRLQGAEALATGHYARVVDTPEGRRLARGLDPAKDQSYFLYRLTREHLTSAMFPLGELTKTDVRAIAADRGLPVADKPESQEVCFVAGGGVAGGRVAGFVASRAPEAVRPGPLLDTAGREVGRHDGLPGYTVGQRKGLGGGSREPRYVVALRPADNAVVVGGREDLLVSRIEARHVVWHGAAREEGVGVQMRYRQPPAEGDADFEGDRLRVTLHEPVAGVAPGQAVVCYRGDIVLGGGVVVEAG